MIKRPYLKKLIMPILILLLWAVLALFPLPSSAADLITALVEPTQDATSSPESETASSSANKTLQTILVPEIEGAAILSPAISITFPRMPIRNLEQSGLKAGDQFSVMAQSIGLSFTNVSVDLHELGLPTNVPMNRQPIDTFFTAQLTLPASTTDGTKSFVIHAKDSIGNSSTLTGTVVIDNSPPTGTLRATFSKSNDLTGTWTAHVSGTFKGTGSDGRIVNEYTYGVDEDGKHVDGGYSSSADTILQASSPFSLDLPITAPGITWSAMGYAVTLADQAGNLTTVESKSVPIERPDVPLIDHAIRGSVVSPKLYSNIPAGVGIPYSLIDSLPRGDYYAVVFFDGVNGCPSPFYQINAFSPGSAWGLGVRPNLYAMAYRTSAGGCMGEFSINPDQGDGWLWGGTSSTGSASVIADSHGIPAFAICASANVCDKVLPHELIVAPEPTGISNVLFLPGIEGSNLYRHNDHCNDASGVCDAAVWLPQNNSFVPQLFLGEDGKSLHDDIYVKDGDILTQAYGKKFYTSFTQGLDDLQTNGKFGLTWKWKAIAYDWRLSLSDIVTNGVERNGRIYYEEASSTPYIEQELRKLAATSKTGKVTIVAHSNGGLVAKALMQKLGFDETDKLVDKVVFVGTPQSGVPEAIGALFYGDKQEIPNIKYIPGLIMSTVNARTFGLHSPMAYSLLPTDNYFNDIKDLLHPVLSFTANTLWGKERAAYGRAITNRDDLQSFALDREGGRIMPAPTNLTIPNVLSSTLYQDSILTHISVDSWIPSEHVKVYQIAGWGADTVSGIDLYERPKTRLGIPTGGYLAQHRLSFVEDGDGSVPVPSALMMFSSDQVKRYWENLKESKKGNHTFTHIDLFEIPQLQTFVQNLIAGSEDMPDTIYAHQPATTDQTKKLIFTLHSIEDFDLSDAGGNHTGTLSNGTDESIPGSTFGQLGDTQYAIVPSGQPYELTVHGTSSDPFTLDIAEMTEGVVTASITFADVPSTDQTHASLSITNGIDDASVLAVDTDGDGTTDYSVSPSTGKVITNDGTDSSYPIVHENTDPASHQIPSQPTAVTKSTNGGSSNTTIALAGTSTRQSKTASTSTAIAKHSSSTPSLALRENGTAAVKTIPHISGVSSTPKETLYVENNQMAAVPENAFLRLLVSIATLLSRMLMYVEGIAKVL
ncbi:MAG: Lecithin-cholesterol acyltransferase [Parcubacteria group bacterium]|nr:Lecithin-cholesterol acyltransferase [Parcubacteria group bacterium]